MTTLHLCQPAGFANDGQKIRWLVMQAPRAMKDSSEKWTDGGNPLLRRRLEAQLQNAANGIGLSS
jgi:hypothetical protein